MKSVQSFIRRFSQQKCKRESGIMYIVAEHTEKSLVVDIFDEYTVVISIGDELKFEEEC